ncbi:uncharacterized protein LOC141666927 isoform X2 [Apium graveolens]|uniref:uncharacterized protein LOC141666927 isoform X2 n=1 Tax=Apium graveolens TaxID=4045 RepID=UPI003D7B966D
MATTTKSVDASLWWDPFSLLLTELENVSLSDGIPQSLVKKLNDNHTWFLDTVSRFKSPNQKSREALDSAKFTVGSHTLNVQPELKASALELSSVLCLDEVQSYLLVKRTNEGNTSASANSVSVPLHLVMLQYYIERQCLLKCTRQILMYALYDGTGEKEVQAMRDQTQKLVDDRLENKLLFVLEDLLSSTYPENMSVDFFTLWAEETLIEDNLVLDILFLAYYESFCTCNGKQWKKLCLLYEGILSGGYNFGKLALSTEAIHSIFHAKVQLLLILMETLDLEYVLQMVHDETTFRQGITTFSLSDIQEIDAIISGFTVFENKEAGPLILTWAVYLCLVSSLPKKEEYEALLEIDHVSYVRQAFEAGSLSHLVDILQSNILKDSDGPCAGYRSVLRTFMSCFIASYEISLQLEDNNFKLILDILGNIYRGEESLCCQFWDKDSFIDGPIRCLLCNLEGEFPFRTVELIRLLSALCEGTWPAECVYNFLEKSVGLSSLCEINGGSVVNSASSVVETQRPLCVPGLEGFLIPSKTRGHILKLIDGNTALVRWECTQSGFAVLLLRLAQKLYLDSTEEVLVIFDLLCRLVTFSTAACYALISTGSTSAEGAIHVNGNLHKVNVLELICTSVKKLTPNSNGALMMSMGVIILTKMLCCSPSYISTMALKENIFDVAFNTNPLGVGSNGLSSGSWLLSGRLAKMILIDCEQNESCYPLVISVLDFTMQLVETGVENDVVLALVVFSIQYVLVNYEYWKYKVKDVRWKVMLKVLEVIKKCTLSIPYSMKLGKVVKDILHSDSSVHSSLFRIVCTTAEALEELYVSRLYELVEIEGLEAAVGSVLDILFSMLLDISKEPLPGFPVLYRAVLSSTTKPIPVVAALASLTSYYRNPVIQVGAARLLSMLFCVADHSQLFISGNACFGLSDKQIIDFRSGIDSILCEQALCNEDLLIAAIKMLTSAANYQPAFFAAVIACKENSVAQVIETNNVKQQKEKDLIDAVLEFVGRSHELINSNPIILLNVLSFMKALWQGAAQFAEVLEQFRKSENFWKQISVPISYIESMQNNPLKISNEKEVRSFAYQYNCQSTVLEIMAHELFLQKKLMYARQTSEVLNAGINNSDNSGKTKNKGDSSVKGILSTWCSSSVLENLIRSYSLCEFDNHKYIRLKIAASLFSVHVMEKLVGGDAGNLCVYIVEKLNIITKKLNDLPAFSDLLSQYTQHGYSEGKELTKLILSDLYYHLQGELEGRAIEHRSIKELSQCLKELNFLQVYHNKYEKDFSVHAKNVCLFDCNRLQKDLGLQTWEFSHWKASKEVAETMLLHLQGVNSMLVLAYSKQSALEALITIVSLCHEDPAEKKTTVQWKIPEELIMSSVKQICRCILDTISSLTRVPDYSEDVIGFLVAQSELLIHLLRCLEKKLPLPVCVLVIKSSGSGLKTLSDLGPSTNGVRKGIKVLLELLLLSVELSCASSQSFEVTEMETVESYADASTASLSLLPTLCSFMEPTDHRTLSLATIDLILKSFLAPSTWFPVIQEHLQLQRVMHKLPDIHSYATIPVILNFCLTLARVRGGAEMLLNAGFLAAIRVLFADTSDDSALCVLQNEESLLSSFNKLEKPCHIWGLGLAVITAVIQSVGFSFSCRNVVDYVMDYFLLEKSYMICHYLGAPTALLDLHDKKKAHDQNTQTSLSSLKETELTLLLICVLSKYRNSWAKATKEIDSPLREKCIHLLAFICRGTQWPRDSSRVPPLSCHPVLKEEFEWYKRPSFVNSKKGWFALSPLCCGLDPRFLNVSSRSALSVKEQATDVTGLAQTYFSDSAAVQIYRIAFLLLKFFCIEAECAAKRAEEVGFVDVAHFPELPVPDILHGLQDQGVAIVQELCESRKTQQVPSELQSICILLLQITEMALYLEFCVSQVCGIKPVLRRMEDFSKEIRLFLKVTEGQEFLKDSVKSLKQIISFVYPNLLH